MELALVQRDGQLLIAEIVLVVTGEKDAQSVNAIQNILCAMMATKELVAASALQDGEEMIVLWHKQMSTRCWPLEELALRLVSLLESL